MNIFVTGGSGFIGSNLCKALLEAGHTVVAEDINVAYDSSVRQAELKALYPKFRTTQYDIRRIHTTPIYLDVQFDVVIHLAAIPGVRTSTLNPFEVSSTNITGTQSVLEFCRLAKVKHLIMASSSSVYGDLNTSEPFTEEMVLGKPKSVYAATKLSNEKMAEVYSDLYGLKISALRFFTVYGSNGRRDMTTYSFTEKLFTGEEITLYDNKNLTRDFTYVDDVVRAIKILAFAEPKVKRKLFEIYNIGGTDPTNIRKHLQLLSHFTGKTPKIKTIETPSTEVIKTHASMEKFFSHYKKINMTSLEVGLEKFVDWYKNYNTIK